MDWSSQDVVIEKIQNKINNLRNAAYIADKGKEAIIQNSKAGIEKYTEFKIRAVDYTRFADFLEEILLDINCMKEEEIKQLEDAEADLREKRADAYI
jgi:hypothetical protein